MLRRIVYLIGAGPGAPDLITVRGRRCLRAADVVIYDRVVHARLLRAAAPHAELLDVGNAGSTSFDQEAICYLIAEKAREGKLVARLKWGDPFVFQHGGVEALFLHEQGIPFEVVPGLPAGVGTSAYAGIPLTYPRGGNTLTFVRVRDREADEVNWGALARLQGTIVSYGTASQLATVVDGLASHGRPAGDSAAIVRHGTLPMQQTHAGTLQTLAARLADDQGGGPALLVVGDVVGFRDHLRWFDTRPLFGRRVLVTASREQAAELVERLEIQGAEAVEAPSVAIVPPVDDGPLESACERAGSFDWIVFGSANGAAAFMARLMRGGRDVRALAGPRLCAAGLGTAARLARYGLQVDLIPGDQSPTGVVTALREVGSIRDTRVLYPRGDAARDALADELRGGGAEVTEVVSYRAVTAEGDLHLDIYRQLLERRLDAVTFTSAIALHAFVQLHGADQSVDLLTHTTVATLGTMTTEAAVRYGITPQVSAAEPTAEALVDALVARFAD